MKLKPYPKMKDSGIEWIGEIPEGWKIFPLKIISKIERGKFTHRPRNDPILYDGQYPFIQTGDIENSDGEITKYRQTLNEKGLSVSKMMPENTIVMSIAANIGSTAITTFPVCFPDSIVGFRPYSMSTEFLQYFLKTLKNYLNGIASTTTQKNINYEFLKPLPIPFPARAEQEKIVDYLNTQSLKIKFEIQKNWKLVELLKEKRQSIINQAITKGLDPTVPMKDSGIEWIGEIPEGWDVGALKFILKIPITDGPHITPEFLDEGIPFISAEAIKNSAINFNFAHYISQTNHDEYLKKAHPKKNDILLVKAGNTTGKVALVDVDFDFSIWSPLALIRVNQNNFPLFQFYCMHSRFFQDQINLTVNWNTQPNIGMNQIKNLMVMVPPLNEQKQIADFVDKQTSKIDSLISKTESQIEKLQEFRQSLISSAVTGKICVTN